MKICYLANIRLPTEKAHGLQIMEMCRAFARGGHQVRLIVPKRENAVAGTAWDFYGFRPEFEIVETPIFDFIRFDRVLGRAALWLNALQFSWFARRPARAFAPDVVYARDPWFAHVAPAARYVYEAHDFPKRVTSLHRRWWKRAARIVAVTSGLKRALVSAGAPEKRIVVAHDGVEEAIFAVRESQKEARSALGLPEDGFIAIYTGHLYPYKGADDLLEACAHLRPATRVVFVGGRPDDLARLKARAVELKLSNATFAGQVPHARIPSYLRAADAAVLPTRASDRHAAEFLSPLKLFEYLAAGKSIVATDTPSVREVLDEHSAVFVPPQDPVALARALNDLADAPARVTELERASLRLASSHAWSRRAETVLSGLPEPRPILTWLRRYRTELLIALLAFAIRAVYVLFFPQRTILGGDGEVYLGLSDLVRGLRDSVPRAPTFYPILYPYFLAATRIVFGNGVAWIRLAQAALSAATVFMMSLMARRWIGQEAAAPTGLLGAFYVPMVLESGVLYTETTYAFLLTAAVAASILALRRARVREALLAGVIFVLAGLTRELAFYQAALYAAWAAIAKRSWKLALALLLPTVIALGGIAVRNAAIAKAHALTSQPLVSKRYEAALTEPTLARFLLSPDRWHLYLEGAYLYFRFPYRLSDLGVGLPIDNKPHPSGDVVYHFNTHELVARQPLSQLFAKIVLVALHWLMLALAAYGFWRGRLAKEAKIGFAIAIVFAFATIMFQGLHRVQGFEGIEPLARYRFPTEPLMLILAVAGAQALKPFRKR